LLTCERQTAGERARKERRKTEGVYEQEKGEEEQSERAREERRVTEASAS
jgi:hypothetical protein